MFNREHVKEQQALSKEDMCVQEQKALQGTYTGTEDLAEQRTGTPNLKPNPGGYFKKDVVVRQDVIFDQKERGRLLIMHPPHLVASTSHYERARERYASPLPASWCAHYCGGRTPERGGGLMM
jgi:hypothetical protein